MGIEIPFKTIRVAGYKSIAEAQEIELKPLTILAGANNSGKSSIIQPLLLLKQTLESAYDPGAILLAGPNVKFSSADQIFNTTQHEKIFSVGLEENGNSIEFSFQKTSGGIDIKKNVHVKDGKKYVFSPGMSHEDIKKMCSKGQAFKLQEKGKHRIGKNRFFLNIRTRMDNEMSLSVIRGAEMWQVGNFLKNFIHLSGLRGNPNREYPMTGVGKTFVGTFHEYTATVIADWKKKKRQEKISNVSKDLSLLGLTWKVSAQSIDDTKVELKVGRLPKCKKGGGYDLVSIADVGIGISQVLPVIVALHAANPGQVVYIEQPEIHLHPKAQLAMADILAKAVNRGVYLIIETHSALLLTGIQSLVAGGKKLISEKVKLHWFRRDIKGCTVVTSANLDERGAFGDWPEDFYSTEMQAQDRYLNAVHKKTFRKNKK